MSRSVQDMAVGEVAYTVPWAVEVDRAGHAWLRTGMLVEAKPYGTLKLRVIRVAEGFRAELLPGANYDPRPPTDPPPGTIAFQLGATPPVPMTRLLALDDARGMCDTEGTERR